MGKQTFILLTNAQLQLLQLQRKSNPDAVIDSTIAAAIPNSTLSQYTAIHNEEDDDSPESRGSCAEPNNNLPSLKYLFPARAGMTRDSVSDEEVRMTSVTVR